MIKLNDSPIEKIDFNGNSIYIKRDDLLNKEFSGNKARKLHYFLDKDYKHITTLISHGSNQSNAMYSLSVLAKIKNWKFIYYTNHIPSFLEQNPNGNYKYALENGMNIIKDENFDKKNISIDSKTLFISEGGAVKEAAYGIKILANEIKKFQSKYNIKNLNVFLPSGTGTTALFLQKYLDIKVLTTPCVGDALYLEKQFYQLDDNKNNHPTIINPIKKYHFGKLYKENYMIYKEIKDKTSIEFDLLYDPIGWNTLLRNIDKNIEYLYIHQGGIIGNITMIDRYKHKFNEFK
ncbi:MAG: 1-aminocyclopropane-1-carboxylate deaminase [Campylobacterota bacterium]|nr:1-aminocyclopropane-1-carboxylate deaminase [Campylobacterota bacterium]